MYRMQGGWRKWAGEHPDMYARRSDAVVPDWYTRRVNDIRTADAKRRQWTWEQTQQPTEKKAYGIKIEVLYILYLRMPVCNVL